MKTVAVVLAAGVGSRLRPLTEHRPKCLVEVAGVSLLWRLLVALSPFVSRAVVVAGYKATRVEESLASMDPGIPVEVVMNGDYSITNSMYSAFVASDSWLGSDRVVFTNSDVVLFPTALRSVMSSPHCHNVLVAKKECDKEDMKVRVREDSLEVAEISKLVPSRHAFGEFTGVYSAVGEGVGQFHSTLSQMLDDQELRRAGWYDLVVSKIAQEREVRVSLVRDMHYAEIDTLEDLDSASRLVESWGTV